eukprot:336551-Amphidinium_carterae.1
MEPKRQSTGMAGQSFPACSCVVGFPQEEGTRARAHRVRSAIALGVSANNLWPKCFIQRGEVQSY